MNFYLFGYILSQNMSLSSPRGRHTLMVILLVPTEVLLGTIYLS
jgi:hypothetical protein